MTNSDNGRTGPQPGGLLWLLLVLLGGVLAYICREGFGPHQVMWANDTSMAALTAPDTKMPGAFLGTWLDHWWIGIDVPSPSPSLSNDLIALLGPVLYCKVYAPFTMLFLGCSAWLFFRQLKFAPIVCVLGGLAAGLNMHCFSVATWGLGVWNLSIAMIFLALAAMFSEAIRPRWVKYALAGLAVGLSVMEGFDSGAILSVYAAAIVVFLAWFQEGDIQQKIGRTFLNGALVVAFAVFIAISTIWTLVGTQIVGIVGTGQSAEAKSQRWDAATAGSLPKIETLRLIIPGLFGYRLVNYDTTLDHAGVYWGSVNSDPHFDLLESSSPEERVAAAVRMETSWRFRWPDEDEDLAILKGDNAVAREAVIDKIAQYTGLQRRHTGSAEYAGILVAVLAVFGIATSARGGGSSFSLFERRLVWFCAAGALFALVAAWGRHSFLYALIYKLPYASTVRNPIKFLHAFHLLWIILAGFGLEALYRGYLRPKTPAEVQTASSTTTAPVATSARLPLFDWGWIGLSLLVAAAIAVSYWVYAGSGGERAQNLHRALSTHIMYQGFDEDWAGRIAEFATREVGYFVVFFLLSCGTIAGIVTGLLRGKRAMIAWAALAVIMAADLARADRPWVRYFNYEETYALNPVLDFLRQHPHEYRVAAKLNPNDFQYVLDPTRFSMLGTISHWWLENDFPFYGIETVDIDQMPRLPTLEAKYLSAFQPGLNPANVVQSDFSPAFRLWRLANVRYVLAPAGMDKVLNERADPVGQSFQTRRVFNLVSKPGVAQPVDGGGLTAVLTDDGPFSIIEISNTLPRVKLFSAWYTPPTDDQVLGILNSPRFEPTQTVLVSPGTPVTPPSVGSSTYAGSVAITNYEPKDIQIAAHAATPAVLLLNDRTDPAWHVSVDGHPAPLLLCNYIMQGVYLTPGEHMVEFKFEPSRGPLMVTCAAFVVGLALAGFATYNHFTQPPTEPAPALPPTESAPVTAPPAPDPAPKSARPRKGKRG